MVVCGVACGEELEEALFSEAACMSVQEDARECDHNVVASLP